MHELGGALTRDPYEPPALRVVGSLHDLTQTGRHQDIPCFWTKTIGPPDYFTFIPIANCSS
jgi:hypothetical protein